MKWIRALELTIAVLVVGWVAASRRPESENDATLLPSMNDCTRGMTFEQCLPKMVIPKGNKVGRTKDGGKSWSLKPYFYEFSPEGVLRSLACSTGGILRYGNRRIKMPTNTRILRAVLGDPDQILVHSLLSPGDMEGWLYFRLGVVATVLKGGLVSWLVLKELNGPQPGGKRVILPSMIRPRPDPH